MRDRVETSRGYEALALFAVAACMSAGGVAAGGVAAGGMAAGCAVAHSPADASEVDAELSADAGHDASPLDAYAVPDAFAPDAFCPDADGDGESDARCGGADCDDDDASVSSTRSHCASPTSLTRCVGGVRTDAACEGATPYCDARVDACVADACGDHVVHPNEQCDDGRGMGDIACVDCRQSCRSSLDCSGGWVCRPFESMDYGRTLSACAAPNLGGAEMGTRCSSDAECYSGLCDAVEARCTESFFGRTTGCDTPHRWPRGLPISEDWFGNLLTPYAVCQFECEHDSDCGAGATCVPAMYLNFGVGQCDGEWLRGAAGAGEACTRGHDCASGVCVDGACSQMCRTAADCSPATPRCEEHRLPMMPEPRPADWGTEWLRVCLP